MTTKRFEVYDDGFSKHIEDTYYTEDKHEHNLYDIWEMCRKLNELHSRNKRLEEKIQRERTSFMRTHERWSKEAETKIKELSEENEQLKKELLFFYDVANCECSTNWKEDMEKGCKRFFNCTYEEAKEKYGNYDGMWWEIND